MEEQGVELAAEVEASLLVPGEGVRLYPMFRRSLQAQAV